MVVDRLRIIDKIKKCFALSKSSNANEAAVALKQAYALARKYSLDSKIVEFCQITSGRKLAAGNQLKLPLYLAKLLNLINYVFQTRSVIAVERVTDSWVQSSVEFYGYESDIIIAEYAWEVLSNLLIKSRAEFLSQKTEGRMNKSTKIQGADYYCLGWIESIYEEVNTLGREIPEEERMAHSEKIQAYQGVLFKNALLTSKIKGNHLSKEISDKQFAAYSKGVIAGKNVSIGRGMNGTVSDFKLLN